MLHPRALSAPNSATSSPSSVKNPPTPTRLHVPSPWYPIQHQSKSYHNDPETPTNSDNDPYPHICVCPYPAPKLLRSARVPIPKTRTWPNIPPPPQPPLKIWDRWILQNIFPLIFHRNIFFLLSYLRFHFLLLLLILRQVGTCIVAVGGHAASWRPCQHHHVQCRDQCV